MAERPPDTPPTPPPPPPTPPPRGRFRRFVAGFARAFTSLVVRFYALAILLVVVWAGYTAVSFLAHSVFAPAEVPPQYRGWQTALSRGQFAVQTSRGDGLAVARAPVEHYHQVNRALPPDEHNGCVASGCHSPLAHSKHKETRAFANLHATFLACTMCHDASIKGPVQAMWIDTTTGEPAAAPPAALRLAAYLQDQAEAIRTTPTTVQQTTLDLLAAATRVTGDPVLSYLRVQIDTSEPGSPVWRRALDQLVDELPNHMRGEYGAKLARRQTEAELAQYQKRLADLAAQYKAVGESSPQRIQLNDQIHEGILPKPSACLACHGGDPGRLDFLALGYPAKRASALRDSAIARLMQQIQAGQPFHLPRTLEGGNAR